MNALTSIVCLLLGAAASPTAKLRGQIEEISRAAQGRVGVAVTVLETGESVTLHGDEHFPMQSVYKLPIAMAALHAGTADAVSGRTRRRPSGLAAAGHD